VEKYGTARQATDDNIIRRMRMACQITKTTNTHSEYVNIYCFPTAKMAARTCLNISLYVAVLLLFTLIFAFCRAGGCSGNPVDLYSCMPFCKALTMVYDIPTLRTCRLFPPYALKGNTLRLADSVCLRLQACSLQNKCHYMMLFIL
jgi:hypothetical protein